VYAGSGGVSKDGRIRRHAVQLAQEVGGLGPSELKRLKMLEAENARLKRMVADLSLGKAMLRQPLQVAGYPNQIWGMDFVSDALFDGRRLRMLTVIDLYTRECLAIAVGQRLTGEDVARTREVHSGIAINDHVYQKVVAIV